MKKVFSKEIFKQTIKQLALIASLTLLICVMVTVLLLATKYSIPTNGFPFNNEGYNINSYGMGPYIASAIAPILIIVMFVGSVVITYTAFKYQNKRELADKYHSLPYTKIQQFVSRTLAVLAMLYAIIIITMLGAWITLNAVGSKYIPMHIPMLILGYMASTTLLVAITAAAMSFTGNLFANLTVTAVLLFLPRSILFVVGILIKYISYGFIPISTDNVFLNPSTNIPIGVLLDASALWEYHGISETLIAPKGIIYTFVLAIVYLGIALFLSNKRKSELAGKSFANSKLSYIFASLCTAPLFVYAGYFILKDYFIAVSYAIEYEFIKSAIKTMLIPMIFAIILFLIISLIYRAKFKGIAKGFAAFFACAVITFCLIALGTVGAKILINKQIDVNKVEYVTIDLNPEKNMRNTPVYTYGWLMSKDVKIYDHKIIEAMISNMDAAADIVNKSTYHAAQDLSHVNFWCTFHMKNGNEITRYIPIVKGDYEKERIANLLLDNEVYYSALSSLPDIDETNIHFISYLPTSEKKLSYAILKSVLDETKASDIIRTNILPYYLSEYVTPISYPYPSGSVYLYGRHDNVKYLNHIYIDDTIPNSKKLYLKTVSENKKDILDEALDIILNTPLDNLNLEFFVTISENYDQPYWLAQDELDIRFSTNNDYMSLSEQQIQKMCQTFMDANPADLMDTSRYAWVEIHVQSLQAEKRAETYMPISDELYKEYEEWIEE